MPRTKKATTDVKDTSTVKAAKTTTAKKPTASQRINELESKLSLTEKKLNLLVNILYGNLKKGQLQGPEGLAKDLISSGLLS